MEALKDERVVAVSAGYFHTLAVTCEGRVLGWGSADGLGLREAPTSDNEDGVLSIRLPWRYPQLSCVLRS